VFPAIPRLGLTAGRLRKSVHFASLWGQVKTYSISSSWPLYRLPRIMYGGRLQLQYILTQVMFIL